MGSIRTALGIITLVADVIAVFQIVRKAVLRAFRARSVTVRCTRP